MALVQCSECGKQVSTDAAACPHCGMRKNRSMVKRFLIGAVACITTFIAFGIYTGHRSSQEVIDTVSAKLIAKGIDGAHVSIYSYVTVGNEEFTCGSAYYKDSDGVEQTVLFYAVQSRPLMTDTHVKLGGEEGFSLTYNRICMKG